MKRLLSTGILAASVVAGSIYWHASRSVNYYTLHISGVGWPKGSEWHIGATPNRVGYTEWIDDGTYPYGTTEKRITPTYTEFDLGSYRYTMRGKIWQVGLGAASIVGIVFWLSIAGWDGFRDRFSSSAPRIEPQKE